MSTTDPWFSPSDTYEVDRLRARADAAEQARDAVTAAAREFLAAEVAHDSVVDVWLESDERDSVANAAMDASKARVAAAHAALAAIVGGTT